MSRLEHDTSDRLHGSPDAVPAPTVTGRPSPLTALRQRWRLASLLSVLGLLGGLALAATRPVQHTAEARLVVGQLDVPAQAVPGFALATQQLATTYARLVVADRVREDVEGELGAEAGEVLDYSASPIPESAVIRVEGVATSAALAVRATDTAAAALVGQVNRLLATDPGGELLQDYTASRQQLIAATVALEGARQELAQAATLDGRRRAEQARQAAQARLDTLRLQSDTLATRYQQTVSEAPGGPVQSVAAAAVTGDDRARTLQLFGLAGFGLGLLVALLLSVRSSARATSEELGTAAA